MTPSASGVLSRPCEDATAVPSFVDTFEAVTGEPLPPRKSDRMQPPYLASAVGGVEMLLQCMCLYVDRFLRHVNAYTVHGYFTDPE